MTEEESAPTVVRLRALPRNHRVLITGSDGSEHSFSVECIDAAGLGKGDSIDATVLARLEREQQRLTIHDAALRFLNHRDRSAKEVRVRLARREFDADLIDEEVSRLIGAGLVDDGQFATAWVSDRVRLAPRSRRMLLYELAGKGIPKELATAATKHVDNEQTALALAQRKAATYRARPADDARKKIAAFLTRKGYSRSLAARAATTAVDPDGSSS